MRPYILRGPYDGLDDKDRAFKFLKDGVCTPCAVFLSSRHENLRADFCNSVIAQPQIYALC